MSNNTLKKNSLGILISIFIIAGFLGAFQLGRTSILVTSIKKKKPNKISADMKKDKSEKANKNSQKNKSQIKNQDVKNTNSENLNNPLDMKPTYFGIAAPEDQASLQSLHAGEIIFLNGHVGKKINKNEELIKFDDTQIQLELTKAESEKKAAQQDVAQALSNYNTLLKERNRIISLWKKKMISDSEADTINNNYEIAKISLERKKEMVIQIEIRIKLLRDNLDDCIVRSPISGIIDSQHYNLKEIYKSGDTLFHIVKIDKVFFNVKIPERDVNSIYVGKKAKITLNALPGSEYIGIVQRIPPTQGSDLGNYTVEILVENRDLKIKPGMFSKVKFEE